MSYLKLGSARSMRLLFCVVVLTAGCSGKAEARAESSGAAQASPTEEATPFGLKMGMTQTQLGAKDVIGPGMYKLSTVPKPHPDFESYVVQFGRTIGLCFTKAIGKTVTTSVYGNELMSQFTRLRDQIALTYGKSTNSDALLPGSIWNESKDWMMGLVKKERILFSRWTRDSGATLRLHLRDVTLIATGISPSQGFVSVEYYFDNETQCQKEIDAVAGSVF